MLFNIAAITINVDSAPPCGDSTENVLFRPKYAISKHKKADFRQLFLSPRGKCLHRRVIIKAATSIF